MIFRKTNIYIENEIKRENIDSDVNKKLKIFQKALSVIHSKQNIMGGSHSFDKNELLKVTVHLGLSKIPSENIVYDFGLGDGVWTMALEASGIKILPLYFHDMLLTTNYCRSCHMCRLRE